MDVPRAVLESLPSPCLVVDLAAVDRNIERARALTEGRAVRLRPHLKAHKTTRLMRRQLEAGGCQGVTVQTTWEAIALSRAGIRDGILVASPVVDPASLLELAEVARGGETLVVVDSTMHVRMLAELARREGVHLDVLIEIDVGGGRCGVPFGDPVLLDIADALARSPELRLTGLQAYEGHAVLRDDPSVRQTLVRQVACQVAAERSRLEGAGHTITIVSGAGTGTAAQSIDAGAHTELQVGSYVLMDSSYVAVGLPYELAIACVTRCVSRRTAGAAVLNAGLKALAIDHGLPRPVTAGLRTLGLTDEHARIAVGEGVELTIGDVVLMEPMHLDPTVNLHDVLFVWDATRTEVERWPVDARRVLAR